MGEFIKIAFILLVIYGIIYLIGVGGIKRGRSRPRKMSSVLYIERESREVKQQLAEEADKRHQKLDKIGQIARKKPDRIAAVLQKWLLNNNGKTA